MKTNLEIYGTNDVPEIPKGVCNKRLALLKSRLSELLSVHYMKQDNQTISEVEKAIKHWTALRDNEGI